jgi:hypothetical protein
MRTLKTITYKGQEHLVSVYKAHTIIRDKKGIPLKGNKGLEFAYVGIQAGGGPSCKGFWEVKKDGKFHPCRMDNLDQRKEFKSIEEAEEFLNNNFKNSNINF